MTTNTNHLMWHLMGAATQPWELRLARYIYLACVYEDYIMNVGMGTSPRIEFRGDGYAIDWRKYEERPNRYLLLSERYEE